ncbi:ACP phosphodiesterase [Motiliproteus sp. SC1-56]|uniref:acyl carrier protein phosphodiesterase n=1 Tax=Motiliproteus sp. SC1-56 TaxID=2799565 RepID=UPI001A8DEFD6|nr:ACP phosphodiesterase [Motiliproteus sp. SC1-56]
MNFLAHLFLAEDNARARVANLMGDFVRGPINPGWPAWMRQGVELHRRIDAFTDQHPRVQRSRDRFSRRRRRYAGIVLDICFDHYLSVHWARFSDRSRKAFIHQCYDELRAYHEHLPAQMAKVTERLVAQDWLGAYADPQLIVHTLDRVARRLRRPEPMLGAGEEFLQRYAELEEDFLTFFPELCTWAEDQRR